MMTPAQVTKAKEALDALAPLIGRYVAALVESGLSRNEAVAMAQGLQQTVFQTAIVLAQGETKAG